MILTKDGKEITAIYRQDGSEIEEVKDANGRIVYSASREITGTLPLSFSSRGKPLTDYLISGNTVQNGTPAPEAPVDAVGVGERTKNLFDKDNVVFSGFYPHADTGAVVNTTSGKFLSIIIPCEPNTSYTWSFDRIVADLRNRVAGYSVYPTAGMACTFLDRETDSPSGSTRTVQKFTTTVDTHWLILMVTGTGQSIETLTEYVAENAQLEIGSEMTDYESYGYKIPVETSEDILVNNLTSQEYNGLTLTKNADGSVRVQGTATENSTFCIYNNGHDLAVSSYQIIENGIYYIGGGIEGNEIGKFFLSARYDNAVGGDPSILLRIPYGESIRIDNTTGAYKYLSVYITVWRGATVDFTCKPYLKAVKSVSYIYLGEVPTTRRIRKLVLTGEEAWILTSKNSHGIVNFRYPGIIDDRLGEIGNVLSSHLTVSLSSNTDATDDSIRIINSGILYLRRLESKIPTVIALRQWLSDQYAAGTPITVWYVLSEPETGIVNEPLMKIGDYADTISYAQAGVTISTVSGANILDMTSTVKPSEVYIKGRGIKPTGYGQLVDKNGVRILDKNNVRILVHGQ